MEHEKSALTAPPAELPDWARASVNLADARIGARALDCSDDFFAPKERLLQPGPAVFIPGKYDEHGKWMDGWESRRRRGGGHDWCVVGLGVPGWLAGFDVDTSFFTGNYPPSASIDACRLGADPQREASWERIVAPAPLSASSHHLLAAPRTGVVYSHVRLNIFPDGGVARLRVYGRPSPAGVHAGPDGLVDLLAWVHGGRPLAWNDAHFGRCENLLLPGRGADMGDGWETRRRREPGHDWCILALGLPGRVRRIEVDTAHFKGNFPDRCSLQAARLPGAALGGPGDAAADAAADTGADGGVNGIIAQSQFWPTLLPERPLAADAIHVFEQDCADLGVITHVRFNLHPDGGVSRLRLWGERT
jgi:allantoicase